MTEERWDTGVDYDDERRGGGSRFGAILKRIFGDQENPLTWGFPLFRVAGIRVQAHLLLPIFVVVELIATIRFDSPGTLFIVPMLVSLFVLVLLHEFGHCLTCRRVGGEADEIMLWPLGGLAQCRPPRDWVPDLLTTLGGPAVNAVLLPPLLAAVWATTGDVWDVVFNPLQSLGVLLGDVTLRDGTSPWWLVSLWSVYYVNLVLLLFNMLVPMFPMDAGRVVQAVLWSRVGHRKSMEIATVVGLVTAMVLAVVGMVSGQTLVFGVAVFGALTCWFERRRARLAAGVFSVDDDPDWSAAHKAEREAEEEAQRERRAEREQAEVDRILSKISAEGMGSLTRAERRLLKRVSERSRHKG